MSVLKNIGFDEVLNRLGLTEAQVKVIYKNEIEKLEKQERVMAEQIAKNAKTMEDQYLEKQRISQGIEGERLAVEAKIKQISSIQKTVEDERAAVKRDQRDVSILHEKLNEAKETFRQERVIYAERLAKLENGEKELVEKLKDFEVKQKAVDLLSDECYIKKHDLDEALKASDEIRLKANAEKNEILALKLLLDEKRQKLDVETAELETRKSMLEKAVGEAKEKLMKDKEDFYQEKRNIEESLRTRQLELSKKEKFIEETEASVRKKHEDVIIEESRKKKK